MTDLKVDDMAEMIKEKERELFELKEAEKLVRDEMKALGYDYGSSIRWYNF